MNTFAAILATLQLLAHALAGCCWHHGHYAAESLTVATHSLAAKKYCSHSEHRHAEPASNEDEQHDGAPDSCSEPRCVFIVVGDSGSTLHLLDLAPLSVIPAIVADAAGSVDQSLVDSLSEHDVGPPVRLHAFKQVLLI